MKRSTLLALFLSLFLAACGDDDSGSSPVRDTDSSSSEAEGSGPESSEDRYSSSEEDLGPVVEADSCGISGKDECEFGTLTDDRDGLEYKTVKIGKQTWMAENLNYEIVDPKAGLPPTPCFDNKKDSCSKYGRYYTWAQAVDSAAMWSSSGKGCGSNVCRMKTPVRGICPKGWHLPSKAEWVYLLDAIGWESSFEKLASKSGWFGYKSKGRDLFGFTALPGHRKENYGNWGRTGTESYFWSSTQFDEAYAFIMYLNELETDAYVDMDFKRYSMNVRCIQDE